MDFDADDAYLLKKIAMAEAESEDTEGQSTWHSRNLEKLFEHGAHTFYTEKE